LENYGEGLHHLGFFVPDMDPKLKIAKQIGLNILLESEFKTAGGGYVRFAYLDTRKICGIIIELANIKLYGVNVPQTELMMNVGRLTGDVLKTNIYLVSRDKFSCSSLLASDEDTIFSVVGTKP
jgi:hypothetical protein